MKIPKKVVITKDVYTLIKSSPRFFGTYNSLHEAELFLLGKNKQGIYTEAVKLSKAGHNGCMYMPQIQAKNVLVAYLELCKKKLRSDAFAVMTMPGRIVKTDLTRTTLGVPNRYPNHIWFKFDPEPEAFAFTDDKEVKWIPVKIQ